MPSVVKVSHKILLNVFFSFVYLVLWDLLLIFLWSFVFLFSFRFGFLISHTCICLLIVFAGFHTLTSYFHKDSIQGFKVSFDDEIDPRIRDYDCFVLHFVGGGLCGLQMISPGLTIQNDKSMMQLCDMCRHHINNNGCYCWSWSLPFSMECTKDTYPHLSVSIKCSFVFSCSLWTCLKPYTCPLCLGPALHLPHPCNLQLTLQEWVSVTPPLCPFVGCGSYYGHCCSICKSVYILKTGTPKKENYLWKTKEIVIVSRKSTLNVFLLHYLHFSPEGKKEENYS